MYQAVLRSPVLHFFRNKEAVIVPRGTTTAILSNKREGQAPVFSVPSPKQGQTNQTHLNTITYLKDNNTVAWKLFLSPYK
jgi:hypothetical protein